MYFLVPPAPEEVAPEESVATGDFDDLYEIDPELLELHFGAEIPEEGVEVLEEMELEEPPVNEEIVAVGEVFDEALDDLVDPRAFDDFDLFILSDDEWENIAAIDPFFGDPEFAVELPEEGEQ